MKTWNERQLDLIRSSSPVAFIGGTIVIVLVYFLYKSLLPISFAMWCAGTIAWNTFTFCFIKNIKVYSLGRWVSSALWAVPPFFWLEELSQFQQAMWFVIAAAMCCGSMSGNVFSKRLSFATILTYITPVALFPLLFETMISPLFAGLVLVFGYVISFQAFALNRSLKNEFDLNLANKELTIANERKARSLVKHERLVNLSQIVGGVAHEINNPLSIIVGYAENIQDAVNENRANNQSLISDTQKILAAADRASGIIKTLRKIATDGSTSEFEAHSAYEIIHECVRYFKSQLLKADIEIEITPVHKELNLLCQPGELHQAFMNLITNSMEALEDKDEKWIKIKIDETDEQLKIHFIDSGNGIPKEIQPQIMQPFFTTKEIGFGAGLGLSLAHSIIESHGGSIELIEDFKNTCFLITLPRLQSATQQQSA